jgi:uncharacterized protein involved in exopolysaccharide biosynthesis
MFQHMKGFGPSARVTPTEAAAPPQAAPAPPLVSMVALGLDLRFVCRRRRLIAGCVILALLLGVATELAITPRYRAISQIMIGPSDLHVVDKSVMPTAQTADANVIQVESETRILTSDRVLRRVVDRERLTADPEFGTPSPSLFTRLRSLISSSSSGSSRGPDADLAALRQLQRGVTAKRSERTYVVELMVDTTDPEKSTRIANAIAQAYLDEQTAARADAARRASDSMSGRLSELREQVRQAEERVERYKQQHNIVNASGRLVDEQQLTELNNQLTAARARAAEAKARYDQILRLQRSGTDPGAIAEAVQSSTIGRLREMYATVARQEATLVAELGPRHPWVIDARAQLRNAQRMIAKELARIAEASRNDYERAVANENSLTASLDALKRRSMDTGLAFVKLRELERDVEASRAVYQSFLVRTGEMREQERLDTANVRILSDAQPQQERVWPPRRRNILLAALLAGLLAGVGLAYLAEVTGWKLLCPIARRK